MTNYNYYNKNLKSFAREHRNNSTKAEVRLWCELLQNKQMLGYSFLRQRPIDKYIVDFFCKELKLVIETDGLSHQQENVMKKDFIKENALKQLGYSVLRFTDDEIIKDIENVRKVIEQWISHPPAPFSHSQINTQGGRAPKE